MNFNIEVNQKEAILWQLRVMLPHLTYKELELVWYVYEYPTTYIDKLVENKITPNKTAANALLYSFLWKGVMLAPEGSGRGKKLKRYLDPNLVKALKKGDVQININIKLKE